MSMSGKVRLAGALLGVFALFAMAGVSGAQTSNGILVGSVTDQSGAVIGMTLVNVRFILERDGMLTLSLPPEQLAAETLTLALVAA